MEFLKNQAARAQQQFGQLTASQKMLSMSLIAIMAMTLLWMGHYAGTAEMEPLINQDFAEDDLSRITAELRGRNVSYTTVGSRILVPADKRYEILAALGMEQMLPKDLTNAFTDLMTKMDSPLNSQEKTQALYNEAKQANLAEVIRNFPNVRAARVVIG